MPDPEIDLTADAGAATTRATARSTQHPADRRADELRSTAMALYDAHHQELANFVRAIERDRDAADDIVGESFVRLISELQRGRAPEQPRAWLHRVAANLVVDGGRRRQLFGRIAGRLVDHRTAAAADEALVGWESQLELRDALGTLSIEARTALLLAAHGFSGREIAAVLGRTELATRSLMWRARTDMRERLGGTPGEERP